MKVAFCKAIEVRMDLGTSIIGTIEISLQWSRTKDERGKTTKNVLKRTPLERRMRENQERLGKMA